MLRNFLPAVFFFFLLNCCAICQSTFAEDVVSQPLSDPFALFKSDTDFENGVPTKKTYKSLTSPSLNYVEGLLVVFAQAEEKNGDGKKCDIVEGLFKLKDNDELTEKFTKGIDNVEWKRHVVIKNDGKNCKGSPTAIVNKNKMFLFLNSSDTGNDNNPEYGVIKSETVNPGKTEITWETFSDFKDRVIKSATDKSNDIISVASGGSGIVLNDSLVVPLWYTEKNGNKDVSTIMKNPSNVGDKEWELVKRDSPIEGKYPAIVEWESKKIIMMISCSDGYRKVYQSDNMVEEWTETVGPLSGVWGNTKERKTNEYGSQWGFIAAEIEIGEKENERKKVMLVTQPVEQFVEAQPENKYKLHLWMTDNQRVFDAGAISTEIEKNPSSSLLFAEEKLFVAYETGKEGESAINLKYLKNQSATIKHVLKTWDAKDKELLQSCFAADGTLTTADECTNDNKIPINGLVGFLYNNYSNKSWGDEYWCVNATVTEGEGSTKVNHVKEGLKFGGAGVGATWPVSNQGQNQQYHFVNRAFTLTATVKIDDDTNKNANSILGFVLQKPSAEKTIIGLWCSDGKWGVGDGKGTAEIISTTENCANEKTYQVALTLKDKTVSVYINGNKKEELSKKKH